MVTSKGRNGDLISVLAVYFAAQSIFITAPALQAFARDLYPDIAYSTVLLISTLSSLFMIPGSLLAGAVLGKQVSFRTMAAWSMGGVVIAGVAPFFVRDFALVLALRALVGFCIGLGFPLQSSLALRLFGAQQRPAVLGTAAFAMALGAIVYMVLAGWLCDINAAYVWLVHGLIALPLVLVMLFLREPDQEKPEFQENRGPDEKSGKLPAMAVFASAMFTVVFFAFYPVLLNMSAIIAYENLGTGAVTGVISSLFSIGNALAGLIFAGVYRRAGKYTIPVGLALWALGMVVFTLGSSLAAIVVGVVISGVAVQIVWPGTIHSFSEYVPQGKLSMASALFLSGMNLGCFLTSFFISATAVLTGNDNPRLPCLFGLVIVAVAAALWSSVEIRRKRL